MLADCCAFCREDIRAHERVWELMASIWGRVVCANYCSTTCREFAYLNAERVARFVRARQLGLDLAEEAAA